MQDLTKGRINTNNLTQREWTLIDRAYSEGWFTPTDDEWLLLRNLLGLFEIRRGYSLKQGDDIYPVLQAGAAQIKLNEHGSEAWGLLSETGRCYQSGKPNTLDDFAPHMTTDELKQFDYFDGIIGESLHDLSDTERQVYWNTPELDHCSVCGIIFEANNAQCDCDGVE